MEVLNDWKSEQYVVGGMASQYKKTKKKRLSIIPIGF